MTKATEDRRKFINNLSLLKEDLKKVRTVWGLDISLSNTGLTIYDIKKSKYECFSHKFKGTHYSRTKQLENSFIKRFKTNTPDLVILEGWSYGSRQGREVLGETTYAVKRNFIFEGSKVLSIIVPPLSLKKYVALRGKKVEKKEILHIVKEDWNAEVSNHDEADSYALAIIAKEIISLCSGYEEKEISDNNLLKEIKDLFEMTGMEKQRSEVIFNIILNETENIRRFFI